MVIETWDPYWVKVSLGLCNHKDVILLVETNKNVYRQHLNGLSHPVTKMPEKILHLIPIAGQSVHT